MRLLILLLFIANIAFSQDTTSSKKTPVVVKTDTVMVDEMEEIDELEEEEDIFIFCEQMPQFKGGEPALRSFLKNNMQYPENAKKNGVSGIVYVNFIVTETGKITDVKIIKGVHPELDKEALRLAKAMPNWEPGKQRGKSVKVFMKMPIRFNL